MRIVVVDTPHGNRFSKENMFDRTVTRTHLARYLAPGKSSVRDLVHFKDKNDQTIGIAFFRYADGMADGPVIWWEPGPSQDRFIRKGEPSTRLDATMFEVGQEIYITPDQRLRSSKEYDETMWSELASDE